MLLSLIALFAWTNTADVASGDRVVLNDRTYVLMTEDDFRSFNYKLKVFAKLADREWKTLHSTEGGRVSLHGRRIGTTVTTNETGRVVSVVEYEDGYRNVTQATVKRRTPEASVQRRDVMGELKKRRNVNLTKEVE